MKIKIGSFEKLEKISIKPLNYDYCNGDIQVKSVLIENDNYPSCPANKKFITSAEMLIIYNYLEGLDEDDKEAIRRNYFQS